MDYFYTAKDGKSELVVSKSRFLGFALAITNEADASEKLRDFAKKYYDATHICYAYICGENAEYSRFSDDREPSGTAGLPLLNILKNKNMNNVLLVVVRYYGGTKLGVGGLARAYSGSGISALDNAQINKIIKCQVYNIKIDFTYFNQCVTILNSEYAKILVQEFTDRAVLDIAVKDGFDIEKVLRDKTSGNIKIKNVDCRFVEWN